MDRHWRVAPLHVWTLGGFHVRVGAYDVPAAAWRRRKAATLVKLLALAPGHRLHVEQALDTLWPDLAPAAARNNLHRTLHAARRTLEPDLVAGTPPAYLQLDADILSLSPLAAPWVDVAAFEAAAARRTEDPAAYEQALDLYASDLLPDDRYEDWAIGPREALRGAFLDLRLKLAEIYERGGDRDAAIATLRRAVASEPTHAAARAALTRLLDTGGQRPLADLLDASPRAGSGTNLPHVASSFIDREEEVASVRRLLAAGNDDGAAGTVNAPRLVTLAGPGGSGKTRLALEAARDLVSHYPHGVWLVELATVVDPALVPQTVARALHVRETPDRPLTQRLVDALRAKRLLLVLDNCEHLLDATAPFLDTVLRACPHVRVLATSREPLGVTGEAVWPVPPLPVPAAPSARGGVWPAAAVCDAGTYAAVRLFVERARAAALGFALTEANAGAVVEICARLEGLPLALELAAARAGSLSVQQIAARLDDCLSLLTRGDRTAPRRHQTLRAALDWSYGLLSSAAQQLLARLSVFAGGWSLEAVEAVGAGGENAALDVLTDLVDKSLVVVDTRSERTRYRLLEPVRQYAAALLGECSDAAADARRQHLEWYLALRGLLSAPCTGPVMP